MRAVHSVKEVREALESKRKPDIVIGLVPTMGALHIGHERLIQTARTGSDFVVVTIFVNPLQFGPSEDYSKYPRALPQDLEICRKNGTDLVFTPSVEEMYPLPQVVFVEVTRISEHLCGAFRPGHFRGVATVVLKLFNIVEPRRAFFGEKDMQQLAVIRRMASDLNLDIEIVGVPTVRESDGLAVSSRNQYLDKDQRKAAPVLFQALQEAARCVGAGERDAKRVRQAALAVLNESPIVRVEYLEVVDPEEIQPLAEVNGPVRVAGAVWLGSTRLIDNLLISPSG